MSRHFILDWGTFPNETLVIVGMPPADWPKAARRYRVTKEFTAWVEREAKDKTTADLLKHARGAFFSDTENSYSILWLEDWADRWDWYEVLIHELHHAVHTMLGEKRDMANEMEALAYTQEFLFRQARRALDRLLTRAARRAQKKRT